ncbi:sialate O-acetylesterase [Rhodopirellula sp. SWK7]|uniref:sialate O-acetylesterase n=1 Tax=Rhodopirellula sp. SWK7 TaxID=595460 RepID=UPI0002BDE103|nr:sialate O-acetylesterase [Rhodopirellula sp. SWK7]EMI46533.1 Sialate O-acetylesterase [Rhodopirellula sp. SWK7]
MMYRRVFFAIAFLSVFLVSSHGFAADVASLFSDHMVLQRDARVPIWGTGADGQRIRVSFAGQTVSTVCERGAWRLELEPLAASAEPRVLTIEIDGRRDIKINDVLVGEVWVGSGQSNMAGNLARYAAKDPELAKLASVESFSNMRLLRGGPKPTWTLANQGNVGAFSALCFPFGERLQRDLKVPVGLMVGAVGGTPSGYWIPEKHYKDSKICQAAIDAFAKTYDHDKAMKTYQKQLDNWERRVAKAKEEGTKPRGRKPVEPKGPGSSSRGGRIGGLYETYISSMAGYRIRGVLWDQGEGRSGVVGVDQYTMMKALIEAWRKEWGQDEMPFLFVQKPSGGGCAVSNSDPMTAQADPFVDSLPDVATLPVDVASGRESLDRFMYQRLMHDVDNGWMIPVCDLGSGIHPTNKWAYGNRAAAVALSKVYGMDVPAYGPMFRSCSQEDGKLILEFDYANSGLMVAHSETLQGFAVANKDGQWHWADAKLSTTDGRSTVTVWSADVPDPARVCYAFADRRAWANLFNKDGLPALAFIADVD